MLWRFWWKYLPHVLRQLSIEDQKKLYWQLGLLLSQNFGYERSFTHWNRFRQPGKWRTIGSPFVPSRGDIHMYMEVIRKYSPKNILLLGSTPELRDELTLYQKKFPEAQCVIADQSPMMLWGMLQYSSHTDPEKEVWVKGKWEELPLAQGTFDLIIGDLVVRQFPAEEQHGFFQKIASLMSPQGVFVARYHAPLSFEQEQTVVLAEKFFSKSQGIYNPEAVGEFVMNLLIATADIERRRTRFHSAQEFLDRSIHSSQNTTEKHLLQQVRLNAFSSEFEVSIQTHTDITVVLSSYFSKIETYVAQDYRDSQSFPIFAVRL